MVDSVTILARMQLVRLRMALHFMHATNHEFLGATPLPTHMQIRAVAPNEKAVLDAMRELWLGDA